MKLNFDTRYLRQIPIAKRFLLLILIISILPIMIVGNFSYFKAKKNIETLSSNYNKQLIETLRSTVSLSLKDYLNLSNELMLNPTVRKALVSYDTLSPSEKYDVTMQIYKDFRAKYSRISGVFNVRIATKSNMPIHNSGYLYLDDQANNALFAKIANHNTATLWHIAEHNDKTFIVLSRKIRDLSTSETIGYITMHIYPSALIDNISDFEIKEISSLMLIDSYKNLLPLSSDSTRISKNTLNNIYRQTKTEEIQSYTGDKTHSINYTYIPATDWTLISATPYKAISAPIKSVRTTILFIIFLCIASSIVISRYVSRSITIPLEKMIANIEDVSDMRFKTQYKKNNDDELEFLTGAYNKVLDKMQELTTQVEAEQEEKRLAEIKMLQAQINPHFLFNTLDSLRFTALMSNVPTLSDGLSSLSHILRNSIIDGKSYIPIMDEVKNIEDYLTIQKIRYGEIVHFYPDITNAAKEYMIMKFLLQPLVENSIIHGGSEDTDLDIYLEIKKADDTIDIILRDTGTGFDVEKQYDTKTNRFKSSKMSGVGLENVRQRLALEYGSNQHFSIESTKGEGTTIKISFPATDKGDENV